MVCSVSFHANMLILLFLFSYLVVSFILNYFYSLFHPCFIPFHLSCCRIPFLFIMIGIKPWLFCALSQQQVCSSCSSSTGQRTRQPRRNVSWKRPRLRLKEKLLSLRNQLLWNTDLTTLPTLLSRLFYSFFIFISLAGVVLCILFIAKFFK